jgi:voltage-gated potassium channel Kch
MSNVERNPSFKIIARQEGRRSGVKTTTVKNAGDLLVQDNKSVADSSDVVRVKKMFAVIKDRNNKKRYA